MRKKILATILFNIFAVTLFAQWQESGSCQVNVYDPYYANINRENIINATCKMSINGTCTGTLINRNTSDNDLGFYLLTARHCISDIDFNANHTLLFNYQSPGANDELTPTSNRGMDFKQSENLETDKGYEYFHVTKLRLVADFVWGDLALVEILTPLPKHFNVSYSGWSPNRFYNGLNAGGSLPPVLPSRYSTVHHPEGDIKKISGINQILWLENPIATGCYTITTIIDFLFGWLWGHSFSTQVICNYVDNPWMIIPQYQYGIVEPGSSGSGVFNSDDDLIGVLSGGLGTCDFPYAETYGKLHANYANAAIKNILNPSHNSLVDLNGMSSRKIYSYDNLLLPGDNNNAYYFPANHYQSNNLITLQSRNKIETTRPITILSGAEYIFSAANKIILKNGFRVNEGAKFIAKIQMIIQKIRIYYPITNKNIF